MPAGYTHYVFGEQVLSQLDENIKKRIMPYIDLYHIGIHGPDILFYYDVYKKNPVKSLDRMPQMQHSLILLDLLLTLH